MNGYVYLLMNPSYTGMLKIGKTTKLPEERVKELSSATGVPTPFVLLYSIRVSDCDYVEKSIHQELEHLGFRNSKNREFFNIDIQDAIRIFQRYEESFQSDWEDNHEGLSEGEQSELIEFFKKNGSKCLAAKPFLDSAFQELRENKKIKLLEKALELKSIQAGIELSLHIANKSDSKGLDYALETYKLIKNIHNDEEYYSEIMLYSKPTIASVLVEAMVSCHKIDEINLLKKLSRVFYEEIELILNNVVLPTFLYIIRKSESTNKKISYELETDSIEYDSKELAKIILKINKNINIHDEDECLEKIDTLTYDDFTCLSDIYFSSYVNIRNSFKVLFNYFIINKYPLDIIKYVFNEEAKNIVSIFSSYLKIDLVSPEYVQHLDNEKIQDLMTWSEIHIRISNLCTEYLENNF